MTYNAAMRPESVRTTLLQEEKYAKEILFNDGSRMLVRNREQWLAAAEVLIVIDGKGFAIHIAYRNITAIRVVPRNGRGRRPRHQR